MYNAERTLESVLNNLPNIVDRVVIVDDGSTDLSVQIAKELQKSLADKLDILILLHKSNRGYGASQKTIYHYALNTEEDIIIMLHPDGQHDPQYIPRFVESLIFEGNDIVIGSRFFEKNPVKFGMPLYKYWGNRLLTRLGNLILGTSLSEMHSG